VVLAASAVWLASGATASTAAGSNAPPACPTVRYHSAPALSAQRVCMNLRVGTHGTQPGTFLFLTPGGDMGKGAGIYRDDGELVWWLPAPTPRVWNLTVVRYQGQPYLALWAGRVVDHGHHEAGAVWLYNEHYQRVGTITMGGRFRSDGVDIHEFKITAQGDALIASSPRVETTVNGHRKMAFDYVVQKLSLVHDSTGIHTGRVLFQWDALKHVPISQSHLRPIPGLAFDYFHGNAIAQDTDGNLLVSARNTWGIYKINVRTGRIMWQVGAKGDHTLPVPWCYQHNIVPLGGNRYSLFDDGGWGPGCQHGSTGHASRGLIVQVAPAQQRAGVRLVRAYTHTPSIYAAICGSLQGLANRDALIGWGNVPVATEYAPDGTVLMDLTMSNWSYRAFRFAWVGQPLTRPSVAAQRAGTGTRVWASWNGSTEVAAWRVLAGPTASHLIRVTGPRGKTGFETEISLSQRYTRVAVQALSASGTVLATSRPVGPS
jgi:hypothetical protein